MPNVSAGSKGKGAQSAKAAQNASTTKPAVPAKKAAAGTPTKKVLVKKLAAKKAAKPAIGKKDANRGVRLGKIVSGSKISLNAYVVSEVQARPGVKLAPKRKLATGAREFTRTLTAYLSPSGEPGGTGRRASALPNFVGFARAYGKMVQAVPARNRSGLIQDLRRALDEAAKAVEMEALNVQPAELETSVSTEDFMAQLRRQETAQREKDIREGKLLPSAEMSRRLGVRPQSLSAALKKKRMFVITGPSGEYYYPAFFADDKKYDRPVLEKVCMALGDLPAGSKWDFFTTQRLSLGGKSPLEALAKGKVDAVMNAAKAFVEE